MSIDIIEADKGLRRIGLIVAVICSLAIMLSIAFKLGEMSSERTNNLKYQNTLNQENYYKEKFFLQERVIEIYRKSMSEGKIKEIDSNLKNIDLQG